MNHHRRASSTPIRASGIARQPSASTSNMTPGSQSGAGPRLPAQLSAPATTTAEPTRAAPTHLRQATVRRHAPRRAHIRAPMIRSDHVRTTQSAPQTTRFSHQEQILSLVTYCHSFRYGSCTRDPRPVHTGPHIWICDVFFHGTSEEMRWTYPLSVAELQALPRSLLQRVHRAFEENSAHQHYSPEIEAEKDREMALVGNYDDIWALRDLTRNRVKVVLGLA